MNFISTSRFEGMLGLELWEATPKPSHSGTWSGLLPVFGAFRFQEEGFYRTTSSLLHVSIHINALYSLEKENSLKDGMWKNSPWLLVQIPFAYYLD